MFNDRDIKPNMPARRKRSTTSKVALFAVPKRRVTKARLLTQLSGDSVPAILSRRRRACAGVTATYAKAARRGKKKLSKWNKEVKTGSCVIAGFEKKPHRKLIQKATSYAKFQDKQGRLPRMGEIKRIIEFYTPHDSRI